MLYFKRKNPEDQRTLGQKLSDHLARFGGSWYFIISFCFLLLIWVTWNKYASGPLRFDPFPYIFLNLILSMIAALQAPVIMMSQNRQADIDRQHLIEDRAVNKRSELQLRDLTKKVDDLEELLLELKEILQKDNKVDEPIPIRPV